MDYCIQHGEERPSRYLKASCLLVVSNAAANQGPAADFSKGNYDEKG